MTLLVDLDVLIYRSCFGCKGDFVQTFERLENYLYDLSSFDGVTELKLILSGGSNKRKEIDPSYKSNRTAPKPRYFQSLRDYSVNFLGAQVAPDEADDMLGTLQNSTTAIASNDKDLLQIEGLHLRIKKDWRNEWMNVTREQGIYFFYYQMLVGDSVDGIKCIPGVGDKKATAMLKDRSKEEMKTITLEQYQKHFGDGWYQKFDSNARLLFIQREQGKEYYDYF